MCNTYSVQHSGILLAGETNHGYRIHDVCIVRELSRAVVGMNSRHVMFGFPRARCESPVTHRTATSAGSGFRRVRDGRTILTASARKSFRRGRRYVHRKSISPHLTTKEGLVTDASPSKGGSLAATRCPRERIRCWRRRRRTSEGKGMPVCIPRNRSVSTIRLGMLASRTQG